MANDIPFFENKKFITIVVIVAVALALFSMFSTTTTGQAWLSTVAAGILP